MGRNHAMSVAFAQTVFDDARSARMERLDSKPVKEEKYELLSFLSDAAKDNDHEHMAGTPGRR
jgi:hypothetical protein